MGQVAIGLALGLTSTVILVWYWRRTGKEEASARKEAEFLRGMLHTALREKREQRVRYDAIIARHKEDFLSLRGMLDRCSDPAVLRARLSEAISDVSHDSSQ